MKFEGLAIAAVVAVFTLIGTAAASPIGVDLLPDLGHVKRQACNRGIAFYDDQDAKLPMNYEGTWTMLKNQGSAFKGAGGTLSYTSQPNAYVLTRWKC